MSTSILQNIYSCSVQKTAPKNTKYSRNESILKIGHHACKGYSPCKILTLAQKLKFQKTCQNLFYKSFTVFRGKNRSKKHQIFEKWEHFENRPSCKGYSPCKILTLAQKLKFQKTCQNPFYKSFTVVRWKKTAPKNTKYSRNESILKIGHHAKAIAHAKSSKNMSKSILQIIYSCSVQKTARKNTKYSRNESILKIGHHAKAIAHAKSLLWLKN